MRDLFLVDIPLFSDRFLTVLNDFGVTNLQIFPAELHHQDGTVYRGYKAVNIIGLVACADLDRSTYIAGMPAPVMDFTDLVIDEAKAQSLDFFRLGENTLVIMVSEGLKQAIEAAGLTGFTLVPLRSTRRL